MEESREIKATGNTTKTDPVVEDLGNQKAKDKVKVKAELEEKGKAEERGNRSTAPVTTVVEQDIWHETVTIDRKRGANHSDKINRAQNKPKRRHYNFHNS